jgi:hypothetical protein
MGHGSDKLYITHDEHTAGAHSASSTGARVSCSLPLHRILYSRDGSPGQEVHVELPEAALQRVRVVHPSDERCSRDLQMRTEFEDGRDTRVHRRRNAVRATCYHSVAKGTRDESRDGQASRSGRSHQGQLLLQLGWSVSPSLPLLLALKIASRSRA